MNATRLLAGAGAIALGRDRRQPSSPAALAQRIIPNYVVTPTIKLISDAFVRAIEQPDQRIIITCPPRTGKSVLVSQVGIAWALARSPDSSVILKSYADELAGEHSLAARRIVSDNSEFLGIDVDTEKSSVGRWRLADRRGGLLAGGILTGTTGYGCDLLVVDDPVKGSTDADSAAYRRRLIAEFRTSLLSRIHPGGSCIIVTTRWHENDLAGELIAEGGWEWINVPAISTVDVPDALDREPGVAMVSALGRTAEQLGELRRQVGSRAWAALYLGVPSEPEGGVIQQAWIDQWRESAVPTNPIKTVIGVDPSDSGERDSCGLCVASLTAEGVVVVHRSISEPMTPETWARRAIELAQDTRATQIAVEAFSAREGYLSVVRSALQRYQTPHPIIVTAWRPPGNVSAPLARSAKLIQSLEIGQCRIAGRLIELEDSMTGWHADRHQPDSLAALVVAFETLAPMVAQPITFASPLDITRRVSDRDVRPQVRTPTPTPATTRHLARSVRGDRYDPMAYSRVTRRI
ncbi:MAG: hypothetical protein ACPGVG_09485 [Mycobacterium sp.]